MPTCPHCGKDIELVSAKEAVTLIPARQEGGKHLSLNTLADWRRKGKFPEPWYEEGNRVYWLRSVVEEVAESLEKQESRRALDNLARTLSGMPQRERDAMLKELQAMMREEAKK